MNKGQQFNDPKDIAEASDSRLSLTVITNQNTSLPKLPRVRNWVISASDLDAEKMAKAPAHIKS